MRRAGTGCWCRPLAFPCALVRSSTGRGRVVCVAMAILRLRHTTMPIPRIGSPLYGERKGDLCSNGDSAPAPYNNADPANWITPLPQRGRGAGGEGHPYKTAVASGCTDGKLPHARCRRDAPLSRPHQSRRHLSLPLPADKGEAVHKSPLQDDEHGMYLMAVMRVGCIDIVDALVGPQGHRGAVPYPGCRRR